MSNWLTHNSSVILHNGSSLSCVEPRSFRIHFTVESTCPLSIAQLRSSDWEWSPVDAEHGIWDLHVTKSGSDWSRLFYPSFSGTASSSFGIKVPDGSSYSNTHMEILDGDMSGVTNATEMFRSAAVNRVRISKAPDLVNATGMFQYCLNAYRLTNKVDCLNMPSLELADKMFFQGLNATVFEGLNIGSHITSARQMFYGCTNLQSVPLFDTSSLTDTTEMFSGCKQVQSGALALYQQMSTQTVPPSTHTRCFTNCGSDTTTGAAELAQIPTSWGGTMSA